MDKAEIRSEAFRRRKAQADKDGVSARILERVRALPEYRQARIVLYYVDARSEVRTRDALPQALADGKTVLVPWCNEDGRLELFRLTDMSELETGMYDIPEPAPRLRRRPDRIAIAKDVDFALIPGVAFDDHGGRVGHGKGYYDKLLEGARPDCPLVAPAFECQLFDRVPTDSHDVYMDYVVTENRVLEGLGRAH